MMIGDARTCKVEAVADQGAPTEEVGQAEPPVFYIYSMVRQGHLKFKRLKFSGFRLIRQSHLYVVTFSSAAHGGSIVLHSFSSTTSPSKPSF